MAKVKSKKITLEEALVPAEEQPYKVPENWCWTYLLNGFAECKDGNRKPINASERTEREGDIPYYGATGQAGWIDDYLTDEQLVLLGEDGAPFLELLKDKAYLIEGKAWVNNHAHIIKSHYGEVGNKYILHYLNVFNFHGYVNGTTRLKLTQASMRTIPVPLPPLAEQKRIVEQIESLFAKLDEAKEKAQEVIDGVEINIEAVLYNAFSGKLTQYWRKENSVDYNWENSTLSKIVSELKYGSSEKSDYNNNGTPVLRIPNIGEGVIDFSDLKYMKGELENSSHEVFENDILIIRSNGSRDLVGKCAIVPALERRYAYASFLIRIKASDKVLPKYLARYINSSMARGQLFAKTKSSSGIHNINSKELGSIRIDVPTIEEQTEILKIIEPLIKKELDVKDITSNMIENIAELKKSILAKAFRGELGTNISSEENSIELLKKMIGEG